MNEACCPSCGCWSEVASEEFLAAGTDDDGALVPVFVWSPLWWKDSAGCPKCGAIVLVESECDFRKREAA
jgi:predicted nucleic-acid-binding Zn-ribbon protein